MEAMLYIFVVLVQFTACIVLNKGSRQGFQKKTQILSEKYVKQHEKESAASTPSSINTFEALVGTPEKPSTGNDGKISRAIRSIRQIGRSRTSPIHEPSVRKSCVKRSLERIDYFSFCSGSRRASRAKRSGDAEEEQKDGGARSSKASVYTYSGGDGKKNIRAEPVSLADDGACRLTDTFPLPKASNKGPETEEEQKDGGARSSKASVYTYSGGDGKKNIRAEPVSLADDGACRLTDTFPLPKASNKGPESIKTHKGRVSFKKRSIMNQLQRKANEKKIRWLVIRLALFPLAPLTCQLWERISTFLFGIKVGVVTGYTPITNQTYDWLDFLMICLLCFQGPLNLIIFLLNPTVFASLKLLLRRVRYLELGGKNRYDEFSDLGKNHVYNVPSRKVSLEGADNAIRFGESSCIPQDTQQQRSVANEKNGDKGHVSIFFTEYSKKGNPKASISPVGIYGKTNTIPTQECKLTKPGSANTHEGRGIGSVLSFNTSDALSKISSYIRAPPLQAVGTSRTVHSTIEPQTTNDRLKPISDMSKRLDQNLPKNSNTEIPSLYSRTESSISSKNDVQVGGSSDTQRYPECAYEEAFSKNTVSVINFTDIAEHTNVINTSEEPGVFGQKDSHTESCTLSTFLFESSTNAGKFMNPFTITRIPAKT
ncbi:hypothetical protein AX774_g810 [Zancudomyces culisetae]|uniref:Uncharacterized protein n=1 Tax=Zancudomyces culisetae TaxID=1213189 RepID=A0A1R1PXG9_ZANCU|nr:hypothetical protein AX774_g810 [Zancudomyces culisetae]|eukprot:OMH85639.1 hypothetical protein AX774_g810 [Zancudomyces culisetae]